MSKLIDENSPALSFMSNVPSTEEKKPAKKRKEIQTKAEPPKKERREVHVNLVLKPSLVEALKDEAWTQRRSLNNLIEEILTNYIERK